ncbi:hypothetical protein B0J11DRAFT_569722 [Dendryphion nanum]|uniref:Uncharacterized protein n=1 Tax=Dendryphion nanum TaxID=256645 RepID=A0A9P9II23_9PLEO|nr:hypothetical protein B0J11DRAFT_569722 [Dendryphion nanum]
MSVAGKVGKAGKAIYRTTPSIPKGIRLRIVTPLASKYAMAAGSVMSTLVIVLHYLCAFASASDLVEIRDPQIAQDVLSLAANSNTFGNLTLPSAGAAPTCNAGIHKKHLPFAHLFKRADGCESVVSRTTNWVTLTAYSTSYTDQYRTSTISLPGNTIWSTVTATTLSTVTRTDVDTATSVILVTVTAAAKKRWEPTPALAPPKSTAMAPVTDPKTPTPHAKQHPLIPLITKFHPHGLLPRQVMRTTTSTTSITSTIVITRSSGVVATAFYSVTSTRFSTVTIVITSAINAKTTVTVTSTFTQRADQTPIVLTVSGQQVPAAPTNTGGGGGGGGGGVSNSNPTGSTVPLSPQSTNPGAGTGTGGGEGSSNPGLSRGAQIGIGAGTGAGSLIICILVGFCLHRRRKNRRAENQELITDAVAAATAAAQSPRQPAQFIDYKPAPMMGVVPIPTPPRHNHGSPSPHQSERYSDLMPSYHSNGTSPAPEYRHSGAHSPLGHEMPLTPMTPAYQGQQPYQYPRPVSPEQPYAPSQSPVEMHHPVPQEISAVYSPRPDYRQPDLGYQQPGAGYPQTAPGYPTAGAGYSQQGPGYYQGQH